MKLKNFLSKALIAGVVTVTALTMSSVSVFAAEKITSNDKTVLTGKVDEAPSNATNCVVTTQEDSVTYKYTINANQTYYGLSIGESVTTDGKLNNDKSFISFETDGKFDIKITPPSSRKSKSLTLSQGTDLSGVTENDIIDASADTSGTPVSKTNCKKGIWSISRCGGGGPYVGTIEITVKAPEQEYAVTGKITGVDYGNAVISIDDTPIVVTAEKTYSTSLTNGTYNVTINSPLYEVSPATITVNGGAVEQNITVTKAAVTTLSGEIDTNLGIKDTITIKGTKSDAITATIADSKYTAIVPQNDTYTIDVLKDSGYQESAFVLNDNTVTVAEEEIKDFPLVGEKITEWNINDVGKTMPEVEIQGKDEYYKGIYAKTNTGNYTVYKSSGGQIVEGTAKGKFASKKGQVNSKTVLEVPLDPATQMLELTVDDSNNVGYKVKYETDKATITVNDITAEPGVETKYSIYISSIKIVDKPTISERATAIAGGQLSYAVDTANNATYVIYGLKAADLKNDKLTLTLGTQEDVTTEVYTTIEFADGDTITAGEGDYAAYAALYAVKITDYAQAIPAGKVTAQLS